MGQAFAEAREKTAMFSVHPQNARAREIQNLWADIATRGSDCSIAGTASNQDYEFAIAHESHVIVNMKWMDYRGGLVNERVQQNDEALRFHETLGQCQFLFVMIEASAVFEENERELKRAHSLRSLSRLLQEAVAHSSNLLGVQLLLTKAENFIDEVKSKKLINACQDKMASLIQFLKETHLPFGITPVSAMVPRAQMPSHLSPASFAASNSTAQWKFMPYQVEVPMVLAIGQWIRWKMKALDGQLLALQKEMSQLDARAQRHRERAQSNQVSWGSLFSIKEVICSEFKLHSEYQEAMSNYQQAHQELQRKNEDLQRQLEHLKILKKAHQRLQSGESMVSSKKSTFEFYGV